MESEFFTGGSMHQLFLVMPNLRSKIFPNFFLYRELWTEFFRAGSRLTFFGHAKFETKRFFRSFSIYRALWTLNFWDRVSRHQLFLVILNLRSKFFWNFLIYRALWTLNFFIGGSGHQNFSGHTKFEVKNVSDFFHLQSTVDTEFFCRQIWTPNFLVTLNFRLKILQNSFLYQVLWTEFFRVGSGPIFFGDAKFETKIFSEFFPLLSALDSEFVGGGGSRHQLFLVMLNLRSKFFLNFLIYRMLWTLNFSQGVPGTNFFWSCQIWGQKLFRIFSFTECSRLNLLG